MKDDYDWILLDDATSNVLNTPWGMVALARGCGPEAVKARGNLAELYRGQIALTILGIVRDRDRADELTQSFMVPFLEGRIFTLADQKRGSFRTFLKVWVKNHVRTEQKKERRRRGRSLDGIEVASEGESPDQVLDRRMTQVEVTEALRRTRAKFAKDSDPMRAFDAWELDRSADDCRTQAEMARDMGFGAREFHDNLSIARMTFKFHLCQIFSIEVSSVDQTQEELGRVRRDLRGPLRGRWKAERSYA